MTVRRRILDEILGTEVTFVSSLQLLINVYIDPLRKRQIISHNDINTIFSNLEMIYGFNKTLLEELQQARDASAPPKTANNNNKNSKNNNNNDDMLSEETEADYDNLKIGDIFRKYAPFFRMFSHYVSTFDRAIEYKAELATKNKSFRLFLEETKSHPKVNGSDLLNFLILPVQRVPRYKMLLQSLIDHTDVVHHDFKDLVKALELVSAAALHNNEHIRRQQNIEKLCEIQMGFESDTDLNLFDSHQRTFKREGFLYKLSRTGKKKYKFWLLSDKILYGKKSILFSDQYTLHCDIDLQYVQIFDPITSESIIPGKRSKSIGEEKFSMTTETEVETETESSNIDLNNECSDNLDLSTSGVSVSVSNHRLSDGEDNFNSDLIKLNETNSNLKSRREPMVIEVNGNSDNSGITGLNIQEKLLSPTSEPISDHADRAFTISDTLSGKTFTLWCNDSEDKASWLKDIRSVMLEIEYYTPPPPPPPLPIEIKTDDVNDDNNDQNNSDSDSLTDEKKIKSMLELQVELKQQQRLIINNLNTNPDNKKANANSIKCCEVCEARFSLLLRRHQCYACSKIICSNCSPFRSTEEYKEIKAKQLRKKLQRESSQEDEGKRKVKSNETARICDECFVVSTTSSENNNNTRNSGSFAEFSSLFGSLGMSPKANQQTFGDTEPSYPEIPVLPSSNSYAFPSPSPFSSSLPKVRETRSSVQNTSSNRGGLLVQIRDFGTFRRKSTPLPSKPPTNSFTFSTKSPRNSANNKKIENITSSKPTADGKTSPKVMDNDTVKVPGGITVDLLAAQMEKMKTKRGSAPEVCSFTLSSHFHKGQQCQGSEEKSRASGSIPTGIVQERKSSLTEELRKKFEKINNINNHNHNKSNNNNNDDNNTNPSIKTPNTNSKIRKPLNLEPPHSTKEEKIHTHHRSFHDDEKPNTRRYTFNSFATNRPSRPNPRSPINNMASRRKSDNILTTTPQQQQQPLTFPKRHPPPPPVLRTTQETTSGLDLMNSINRIKSFYSYEILIKSADELQPLHINLTHKELYLEDQDFFQLFHVHKEIFLTFPKWKQDVLKKQYKLF